LHEHTSEPRQPSAARHSRTVQIGEALLLSLVTIAAAWSGYAAAKWGTESRIQLAQAATLRNLATRANLDAHSTRNFDASTFNAWFTAFTLDDPERQAIAERRFRPEFKQDAVLRQPDHPRVEHLGVAPDELRPPGDVGVDALGGAVVQGDDVVLVVTIGPPPSSDMSSSGARAAEGPVPDAYGDRNAALAGSGGGSARIHFHDHV
jgi:hypothetical protein